MLKKTGIISTLLLIGLILTCVGCYPPEPAWCATPNQDPGMCPTPTPTLSLDQQVRAAKTAAAPSSVLTLSIYSGQIKSWLAPKLNTQADPFLRDLEVYQNDNKLFIGGYIKQGGNNQARLEIILSANLDTEGNPSITVSSTKINQFTGLNLQGLDKTISEFVATALTERLTQATSDFRLEGIYIGYNEMRLTGRAKATRASVVTMVIYGELLKSWLTPWLNTQTRSLRKLYVSLRSGGHIDVSSSILLPGKQRYDTILIDLEANIDAAGRPVIVVSETRLVTDKKQDISGIENERIGETISADIAEILTKELSQATSEFRIQDIKIPGRVMILLGQIEYADGSEPNWHPTPLATLGIGQQVPVTQTATMPNTVLNLTISASQLESMLTSKLDTQQGNYIMWSPEISFLETGQVSLTAKVTRNRDNYQDLNKVTIVLSDYSDTEGKLTFAVSNISFKPNDLNHQLTELDGLGKTFSTFTIDALTEIFGQATTEFCVESITTYASTDDQGGYITLTGRAK